MGSGQAPSWLGMCVAAVQGFVDTPCPIQQEGKLACVLAVRTGDPGVPLPGPVESHAHLDQ